MFFPAAFFLWGAILLAYTICPISLIFQFRNKNKSKFDKWILGLNLFGVILSVFILIFVFIAFPNVFNGDRAVRKQIAAEQETLNKEYQPVLDYLAKYKKEHGVYPNEIDKSIIPNSKTFELYKYGTNYDGKGYWLEVFPKRGPIEYYYNDENDKGYNYYSGTNYIDGFADNDYFYEIDDKWHAIRLQYFTRHSILWNGGPEREVDESMKNNAEIFTK